MCENDKPILTLFTVLKTAKPGTQTAIQQANAHGSWWRLEPAPQIILLSDGDWPKTSYGTPFVRDVFRLGEERGEGDALCYVNADVILLPEFRTAIEAVLAQDFDAWFMVGRRYNSNISTLIDFDGDWQQWVRKRCAGLGDALHIDYFVYPRGVWDYDKWPNFYLGRTKWDNWLVAEACRRKFTVIDATRAATAVHQEHPRGHKQEAAIKHNEAAMRGRWGSIADANWWVTPEGKVEAKRR